MDGWMDAITLKLMMGNVIIFTLWLTDVSVLELIHVHVGLNLESFVLCIIPH
jgi:hypothetical protein